MGIKKASVLYRASLLAISSVLLQLLGFCYRILLGRLAGSQVIAVHGLVMSAYNVVLSCTLTGIAFSVSRIAAKYHALGSGRSIKRLISTSLLVFLLLFFVLALPFGVFRQFFAQNILGSNDTALALLLLLPCLFLTGFENVHKAYFYGIQFTLPPMLSETLEMCLRIGGIVFLFALFPVSGVAEAAALIVLGMVFSEVASACFLTIFYLFHRRTLGGRDNIATRQICRDISSMALPVSLSTLISRILTSANTVLIPRTLVASGASPAEAMEVFGTLSGMTLPLLLLPSAFLSPLITVLTPKFSAAAALQDHREIRRKSSKALHSVGIITFPLLSLILCFGPYLAQLLYHTPHAADHLLPLSLITLMGFYYVICESILEGIGLQKRCAVLAVGATFSGVCLTWLVGGVMHLGLLGYLTGELFSSALGLWFQLRWVKKETGLQFRWHNWVGIPLLSCAVSALAVRPVFFILGRKGVAPLLAFCFCCCTFFLLYSLCLRLLGVNYPGYLHNLRENTAG